MSDCQTLALEKIAQNPSAWAKLAFTDFDGRLRGKIVSKEKLITTLERGESFSICNIIFGWDMSDADYEEALLSTAQSGNPDLKLCPDLSSLSFVGWEEQMPFLLCDILTADGFPHPLCPRSQLKIFEKKIQAETYDVRCAYEIEANLFMPSAQQENVPSPVPSSLFHHGFSLHAFYEHKDFYRDCLRYLPTFNLALNAFHQESSPGMFEISLGPRGLTEAADQLARLKHALRELALKNNLRVSFMAKWSEDYAGLGAHLHLSLWRQGKNLFFTHPALKSSFLAGLVQLLPQMTPLLAPTINSYRRYCQGEFTPTHFNWGEDQRHCAFRLLGQKEPDCRVENRLPGADVNPYWGILATMTAGFFGLDHHLRLEETTPTQALPQNLYEATALMRASPVVREIFSAPLFVHWVESRLWEWHSWAESFPASSAPGQRS